MKELRCKELMRDISEHLLWRDFGISTIAQSGETSGEKPAYIFQGKIKKDRRVICLVHNSSMRLTSELIKR